MKTNKVWVKRVMVVLVLIACGLITTETLAFSPSDFHASVTGIAVVDDYMIFYDKAARANVDFSSPQTHLVVPYGKSLLLRVSYACPDGFESHMCLWTCAGNWEGAHGGWNFNNPTEANVGRGTAYGFLGLGENRWDSTLKTVRVIASASTFGEWDICTVPVNILFIGGHFIKVDFDSNGVLGGEWMNAQHFYADEPQKLSKNTFAEDGMIFQGWATTRDRASQGIVDYLDEEEITVDTDMILYAVWTRAPTIYFDPNTATEYDWENWKSQFFTAGEPQKLLKNTYTRDGWVFQGWATTWERASQGYVDYVDEEEITINSDMCLYAVWTAAPLTLEVESADWSQGALTLRCVDADTSGVAHSYSLYYRDNNTWEMIPVEGVRATNVTTGADGVAHLTDTGYASRQGGLGEVYYCVADTTGRLSDICVARKRYALCVGVGHYKTEYQEKYGLTDLPLASVYAEAFAGAARRHGEVALPDILTETHATRQALDDALDGMAAKAQPGDICLFYIATHGYLTGTEGGVCLYDGDYTDQRLVDKVEQFSRKGAALVAVLSACQSEALVQRSFANVGIIAAACAESYSDDFFDNFLIDYGWEKGWAGNNGTVTFGELAEYAKARYDSLYRGITLVDESDEECFPMTMQAQIDNLDLLERITAGTCGSHSSISAPGAISGIEASKGIYENQIEVEWNPANNADGYLVFYGHGGTHTYMDSIIVGDSASSCKFTISNYPWMAASSAELPVRFEVRAYNGAGVGVSDVSEGWIKSQPSTLEPPTLRLMTATPAAGSLTLAWDEAETVDGVTYSVYRGAGAARSEAELVASEVTGTTWTDNNYWSAEPVLQPLNYWVVANGGGHGERESNRVETRHRYGVFVGVGVYEESWFKQLTGRDWFESRSDPPAMVHAELLGRLAHENGGFPSDAVTVLTGESATKSAFHNALQDVAQKVQTGDYVVLFCSTHGHLHLWYQYFNGIVMHDALYSKKELASDLEALATDKNGLNVVVILNSCYSGGACSASPDGQNFAWIVTSKESEETGTFSKTMGTPLTHYLLEYGWNRGRAGEGPGTMGTFADLWNYAKSYMAEYRQMGLLDETQGVLQKAVLEHFIAGRLGSAQYASVPETPTVTVTAGENKQTVSWTSDSQAEYFAWVRENENNGKRLVGMFTGDVHTQDDRGEKLGISYLPVQSCLYRLAAINEHGISGWSEPARGIFPSKFWNWLVDKYDGFNMDESTPEETVAAVAESVSPNGTSYAGCYLMGLDSSDSHAEFKTSVVFEDGGWKIKWSPDLNENGTKEERVYWVEGKKEMTDTEWTDVTNVEDLDAEGWRFFRVGVEMPE